MDEYFERIDMVNYVERLIRKEQVIRDRQNPYLFYSEEEFIDRFRLSKECVMSILQEITEKLEPKQKKVCAISPLNQLLVALRFYATGSFLRVSGDLSGVHESPASRIVTRVSRALASLYKNYVTFPTGNKLLETQRNFMQQSGIPGIIGVIDCTHIPIQSPGGNRKGYFSINVQAICDHELMLTNLVAIWPGSTHESRIFQKQHLYTVGKEEKFREL